jgi:hypothetical protein
VIVRQIPSGESRLIGKVRVLNFNELLRTLGL